MNKKLICQIQFNLFSRAFIEQIRNLFSGNQFGEALQKTDMMANSLKEEGNDWVRFRIPLCTLLFETFPLRADEYDTNVAKSDAIKEIKTFEASPCVKVSDQEFLDALGDEKKEAIRVARESFICLSFPRRCARSTSQLNKDNGDTSTRELGINREPRTGRRKRQDEVVTESCLEDDEILPPELDEDNVRFLLWVYPHY